MTSEQRTFEELEGKEGSQVELRDVTTDIVDSEHKSAPESEDGYPYVKTSDIENGRINFDDVSYVDEDAYQEWTERLTPKPGDIILTREAPVGRVGLIPEGKKVCLGQRTVLIRPDSEKLDNQYLRYLLLSDDIQNRFDSLSTGSTVDHLNLEDLRSFTLPKLPKLEHQRKIGKILSNLDKKYRINNKIIKNLRGLSQSLYQYRFEEFQPYNEFKESEIGQIPEDFQVIELGDICELTGGSSFPKEEQGKSSGDYPFIKVNDMKSPHNGTYILESENWVDEETKKDQSFRVHPAGAIVYAKTGA
ncbi:MAG: restriction endonuclease subunit S, partial [Halobacteriaceae archaeon]